MDNFEDYIEDVKLANPIEDVIEESGYKLSGGHGSTRRGVGKDHASLVVSIHKQLFYWNSRAADGWRGDVIRWVEKHKGVDFQGALDHLAKRAGISPPVWSGADPKTIQTRRTTEDVMGIAAAVFHRWLVGDEKKDVKPDQDALDYVRGRAWTEETIEAAMIGFSGRRQAWQIQDMIGDFNLHGIDVQSPAAVMVLGFAGNVREWGKHWDIDTSTWDEKERIHGLMDTPGVIYVHYYNGSVRYLTRRQLPGFDVIKSEGRERAWKSFNPPVALAGYRQPYYNHVYRRDAPDCVIVEGQGDAVSLAQLGQAAVGLCGINAGDVQMERLIRILKKHEAKYLALDSDDPGVAASWKIARQFGPMVRMVTWVGEGGATPPVRGDDG
jgi:DNA primase